MINPPPGLKLQFHRTSQFLRPLEQLDRIELKVGIFEVARVIGNPRVAVRFARLRHTLSGIRGVREVVACPGTAEGDVYDLVVWVNAVDMGGMGGYGNM